MDSFNDWLLQTAGYLADALGICGTAGNLYVFWFALIAPIAIYLTGNLWGVLTDSRPGNTIIPLLVSAVLGCVQFAIIHGCADPLTPGGYVDEAIRTALTVLLNYFVAYSGQNLLLGRNRARPASDGDKRRGWIDPW